MDFEAKNRGFETRADFRTVCTNHIGKTSLKFFWRCCTDMVSRLHTVLKSARGLKPELTLVRRAQVLNPAVGFTSNFG